MTKKSSTPREEKNGNWTGEAPELDIVAYGGGQLYSDSTAFVLSRRKGGAPERSDLLASAMAERAFKEERVQSLWTTTTTS